MSRFRPTRSLPTRSLPALLAGVASRTVALAIPALLVTLTALTPLAAHADQFVAPNAFAATEGGGQLTAITTTNNYTLQIILGAGQFSAMPVGSLITAVGFRLNGGAADPGPMSWNDFDVYLGRMSTSITNAGNGTGVSSTFADNYQSGSGARTQVRGTAATNDALSISGITGGAGPNSFFTINFDTPYVYQGGGLVLEVRHLRIAGTNARQIDSTTGQTGVNGGSYVLSNSNTVTSGLQFNANVPVTQFTFAGAAIPEPGTLALLPFGALALAGAAAVSKRQRRRDTASAS